MRMTLVSCYDQMKSRVCQTERHQFQCRRTAVTLVVPTVKSVSWTYPRDPHATSVCVRLVLNVMSLRDTASRCLVSRLSLVKWATDVKQNEYIWCRSELGLCSIAIYHKSSPGDRSRSLKFLIAIIYWPANCTAAISCGQVSAGIVMPAFTNYSRLQQENEGRREGGGGDVTSIDVIL